LTVTDLAAPEEKPTTGKRATPRESAPARPSSEVPVEPAPDAAEEATR
jgi:hypothetical protein